MIMLLRIEQLASHVAAHAGVSMPLADYSLRAVVTGIGGYLSPDSRRLIAEELPSPLVGALESAIDERKPIEERVQLTGMTPSQTWELVASVCRVLAEELSDDAVHILIASLPERVATMFVRASADVQRAEVHHRQSQSVLNPNPHGDIKISSVGPRPFDIRITNRQAGSVAEPNPHAEGKLSSTKRRPPNKPN
jgi:uncharacterized protein (DUF2267 family)